MVDSNLRNVQTSFTSGELDPLMRMRSDLKAYAKGAQTARNVALYAQGGARRRPGSIYRANLAEATVLHEYSYTEGQDYILAFQNTKLLIFNSSGSLLQTLTSQPWQTAHLNDLTITDSADTIIVFHKDFWPRQLTRTGASTFTSADFVFEENSAGYPKYQPYFKFTADSVTMTPSATSGTGKNLTCSVSIFESDHVGTIFRYDGKEMLVTSITSATVAVVNIRETLSGTSASTEWDEQAFSAVRGHPRCGVFHSQRLFMAGSTDRPDGIVSSKVNAFFNFDIGDASDNFGIDVTVAADNISEIRHLVSTRNLQIFTNAGELYVPQSTTSPLTPNSISFVPQTPYGTSQAVTPLKFDGATLYMQSTGKVIREYVWEDTQQAYTSNAVSILSNHLINNAIDSALLMGTTQRPEQYAFFVNTDGTLAVFHSVRNEELAGWVQWNTNGSYKSVTQCGNKLFAYCTRTINSSTVHWLEEFDFDVTMDAVIQSTASSTNSWTAAHLPNTTVKTTTNTNAQYLGQYTSNGSGVITTDEAVTNIEIGLDFTMTLKTMPIDAMMRNVGAITGLKKRISRVVASVFSTQSMSLSGNQLILTQVDDDFSVPPTAVDGDYEFFMLGWSLDPAVEITQTVPLPVSIRGLYMEVTA